MKIRVRVSVRFGITIRIRVRALFQAQDGIEVSVRVGLRYG